jgi:hypothetical protein
MMHAVLDISLLGLSLDYSLRRICSLVYGNLFNELLNYVFDQTGIIDHELASVARRRLRQLAASLRRLMMRDSPNSERDGVQADNQ